MTLYPNSLQSTLSNFAFVIFGFLYLSQVLSFKKIPFRCEVLKFLKLLAEHNDSIDK